MLELITNIWCNHKISPEGGGGVGGGGCGGGVRSGRKTTPVTPRQGGWLYTMMMTFSLHACLYTHENAYLSFLHVVQEARQLKVIIGKNAISTSVK